MLHAHIYSLGAYLTNAYTTKKLLLTQTSVEKKQNIIYAYLALRNLLRYMYHFDI